MQFNQFRTLLLAAGAAVALAGCGGGSAEVASPGEGGFGGTPGGGGTNPPGGGDPGPGQAAADCPTGFANVGVVAGGTLRNCQLPQKVTGTLVVPLRAGTIYSVSGRVDVGDDQGGNASAPKAGAQKGILTVEPGVKVFGSAGLDYIVVNRGSQIFAEGTATQPIVFTSRQSIEGQTGNPLDAIGQWGGLVILGRAPISNCPGTATPGTPTCEAQVEGTNAFYGGNSTSDSSGSLKYMRVQHSGFSILPNNELNGITLAGVGNGTLVDYVQVHNSSDDGIEWFGGTVNAKHLVFTGNDDDSMDTDAGFNGSIQFAIIIQRQPEGSSAGRGDRMNEMSALNRTPPSNPKIANFTFYGRPAGGTAIYTNQSTNVVYANGVVAGSGTCYDAIDSATKGSFNSVVFACGKPFGADPAAANFNAGANNNANFTPTLTNLFVNGANESAATPVANLAAISPFFTQVPYIGAVRNAQDTWYAGWTCGLPGGSAC